MKPLLDRFAIRLLVLAAVLPAAWGGWLPAYDTGPDNPSTTVAAQPAAPDPRPWKPEELESLLAPVALYPDPLLAQVLAASTYPLELVEAQQWLTQHPELKGKDLTDAAAKQDWDPSVQALVAFPDVLKRLTENVRWTTDVGNAFLAQQQDVMDAIQRLRIQARDAGKLKTTREQEVTTRVVEERTVVEIVPSSPDVVYVPVYSPEVIWGPAYYYPYPALWYPPYSSAAGFWIGFGTGIALSWFYPGWNNWYYYGWAGCPDWGWGWGWGWHGWGWGCGWGPYSTVIYNNYFCDHYGYHDHHGHGHDGDHHGGYDDGHGGGGHGGGDNGGHSNYRAWQHDPGHRGGVAYRSSDVATRYGANSGRSVGARSNVVSGDSRVSTRGGLARQAEAQLASRSGDTYRNPGTVRDRGSVTQGTRGETVYSNRSTDRSVASASRSGVRGSSANPSFNRDATTSSYRNTDSSRSRVSGSSTYTRSDSSAGRSSGSGVVSVGGASGRDRSSPGSVTVGRSYNSSRSSSGNPSSYSGRQAYGSAGRYDNRSGSGSRSYSGGSPGVRSYSGGGSHSGSYFSNRGSSGNRSYSGGYSGSRSYSGRSFSSGGSSGSRSFSGRSFSGGGGGRSFSGGGGSRSFSSGGGGRSSSGGGSRGGSSGGGRHR